MRYNKTIKQMLRPLPPQYIKWWATHNNNKDVPAQRNRSHHPRLQKRVGALPTISKGPP